MQTRWWFYIALMVMGFSLTGCKMNSVKPNDPAYAPVPPSRMTPPNKITGSIYQSGFEKRLFEDRRANRIGDMLTIKLVEQTKSKKAATTKVDKKYENELQEPTLFGSKAQITAPLPLQQAGSNGLQTDIDQQRKFEGKATSDQSNDLSGTITVTVADVLPNGYLIVRGEKWLTLNQGDEYIRFTGIINPDDVNPNNEVLSTRVADARITYSGKGEVADSNAMGWLAKVFGSVFWPF